MRQLLRPSTFVRRRRGSLSRVGIGTGRFGFLLLPVKATDALVPGLSGILCRDRANGICRKEFRASLVWLGKRQLPSDRVNVRSGDRYI